MRMMVPDEELAAAAAKGDEAAFATLIERHYDRIFRLAFRFTGAQHEAEDLCQDICAALPTRLATFAGTARFTSWLYRVIFNAAQDRRRRMAAHRRAAEGWGEVEPVRRAAAADEQSKKDWLMSAMGRLPEDLRDTLVLILDDLSHAEAAQILGVSEGTISWRMSEVRKHLRALKELET